MQKLSPLHVDQGIILGMGSLVRCHLLFRRNGMMVLAICILKSVLVVLKGTLKSYMVTSIPAAI